MKRILFCWSGGGMPGLDIHCGIWKALDEAGIHSTDNCGTSAGAIMAAFNSCRWSPERAETLLRSLQDKDVRRDRALWKMRLFWIDYFLRHEPIEKLIADNLPHRFDDLAKPLFVNCTDNATGTQTQISAGSLHPAILASMSIAGVFPSVRHGNELWGRDRILSDGGTTAHLPLPSCPLTEFDEVYLLVAKRSLSAHRGHGILGRLFWTVDMLYEDQVCDTIAAAKEKHPRVCVIRPPSRPDAGMLSFDHDLINQSYWFARQQLKDGGAL